jgi:hypothetical protein
MLTLYPPLFGVADNNGYGLKMVFAFLKLAGVPFRHEHIFDASKRRADNCPISFSTETLLPLVRSYSGSSPCTVDLNAPADSSFSSAARKGVVQRAAPTTLASSNTLYCRFDHPVTL